MTSTLTITCKERFVFSIDCFIHFHIVIAPTLFFCIINAVIIYTHTCLLLIPLHAVVESLERILPSMTKIYQDAFAHCSQLTWVEIPSSIEEIEAGAFAHCTNLTSVQFSSFTLTIHDDAFKGCPNLNEEAHDAIGDLVSTNKLMAKIQQKRRNLINGMSY